MSVSLVRQCEMPFCTEEANRYILVRVDVISGDVYAGTAVVSVASYSLCECCVILANVTGECHAFITHTEFRRMRQESERMSAAPLN